jgi:molecular chaperone GrpE (heat shock protein)
VGLNQKKCSLGALWQELFSKLRFSYQEQVTKEKFLQAIIGDQPLIVEQSDIVALEGQLVGAKGALQAQKAEVDDLVLQLERRGRELSESACAREKQDPLPSLSSLRIPRSEAKSQSAAVLTSAFARIGELFLLP